jgi:hypothetical protein
MWISGPETNFQIIPNPDPAPDPALKLAKVKRNIKGTAARL